ncbi:unnamed protein product [Larinioides sclopetarius]|uniref:PUB domain-containing protein n=1 Tax=Larinioides sclopetarius TaxID=280406 RepID=A0AAV2BWK1_9ARAC
MVDKRSLCQYMGDLINQNDSKKSRTAIETLLTIHRNILYNENDVHFRSINPENPNFNEKVWSLLPSRQFMKKCGWIPAHNRIFFNNDEALVDILEILLEYRNVQPQGYEWVAETKIVTKNEEKQRDEELRKKAALEREKEMADFLKDKKYKEELAKQARAEVEADNRRRRQLQKKDFSSAVKEL